MNMVQALQVIRNFKGVKTCDLDNSSMRLSIYVDSDSNMGDVQSSVTTVLGRMRRNASLKGVEYYPV